MRVVLSNTNGVKYRFNDLTMKDMKEELRIFCFFFKSFMLFMLFMVKKDNFSVHFTFNHTLKKQDMSFRQGLAESSHMDVNVAIYHTGYQPPSSYDQLFAQNWIYYKSSFFMEFKVDTFRLCYPGTAIK